MAAAHRLQLFRILLFVSLELALWNPSSSSSGYWMVDAWTRIGVLEIQPFHGLFLSRTEHPRKFSESFLPSRSSLPANPKCQPPTRVKKMRKKHQKWTGGSIPDKLPSLHEIIESSHRIAQEDVLVGSETPPQQQQPPLHAPATDAECRHIHEGSSIPWRSGYHTSVKSQKRIQQAAILTGRFRPLDRAMAVLNMFLSIHPTKLNAANLVCAMTLSAKLLDRETNNEFRTLLFQMNNVLAEMLDQNLLSARQLCNVAWALAKHYDRDDQLLPESSQVVAPHSTDNVFGRAETWDLRHSLVGSPAQQIDQTIDQIAIQITEILNQNVHSAKEGELCMVSWAYGVLRRRKRPPGWKHKPQLGSFSKDVGPIVAGSDYIKFETWGSQDEDTAIENYPDLDERCVTGILLDKIGQALCAPVVPSQSVHDDSIPPVIRIQLCQWNELANLAWAYASHGRSCSEDALKILTAIATEASCRLRSNDREAKSRDIAQIVWSLGTLQADNYRLGDSHIQFVQAVAEFTGTTSSSTIHSSNRPFQRWNCPDIVQVAMSLAHSRLYMLPMLRALYSEALVRLESKIIGNKTEEGRTSFLSWEISVLLWAQARFHLVGDEFDSFAREATKTITLALRNGKDFQNIGIGPQEQANLAWSLTVLELYDHKEATELLTAIFSEAAASCEREGVIQLEHAHQLWQALFLLEDECPQCVRNVPGWFRDYLSEKWNIEKSRSKISSARHRSISRTLALMGVDHINEHDEDIDVAIVLKAGASWAHETEKISLQNGVRVAVEFDGPAHFTRQLSSPDGSKVEPPRALGHTVLKYRMLKKKQWSVVRIPYYEFDKIPFWASMERQRYLQRLLKTHGELRFSDADESKYKAPVANRKSRYD